MLIRQENITLANKCKVMSGAISRRMRRSWMPRCRRRMD